MRAVWAPISWLGCTEDGVHPLAGHRREEAVQLGGAAHLQQVYLQPQRAGSILRFGRLHAAPWLGGILPEDRHAGGGGDGVL